MHHSAHSPIEGATATLFILLTVLPALALVVYLTAVYYQRAPLVWSRWRTASFAVGICLIFVAMSSSVAAWAHSDLRGHMVQHLLLGMFAPLGLVLGAPGTLLLRTVSVASAQRIVRILGTPFVKALIHPFSALLLDIGAMYLLYLTPLYLLSVESPAFHIFLHVHFVLAGYLFTWSIAGPDPAPQRPGMMLRLFVLFLATATHGLLAKLMYGFGFPRVPGVDLKEIQAAAQWMYYGGDLAELLLTIAFFAIWFRSGKQLPKACEAARPPLPEQCYRRERKAD